MFSLAATFHAQTGYSDAAVASSLDGQLTFHVIIIVRIEICKRPGGGVLHTAVGNMDLLFVDDPRIASQERRCQPKRFCVFLLGKKPPEAASARTLSRHGRKHQVPRYVPGKNLQIGKRPPQPDQRSSAHGSVSQIDNAKLRQPIYRFHQPATSHRRIAKDQGLQARQGRQFAQPVVGDPYFPHIWSSFSLNFPGLASRQPARNLLWEDRRPVTAWAR